MELECCPVCRSKELKTLTQYAHAHLTKCRACGFVFSKLVPEPKQLSEHYTDYPRGGELSPITIKRYNELLDKLEPFRKTNKLLDYGCSNGQFLEIAAKRGWEVYGLEFAEECIESCAKKGIKVYLLNKLPEEFFNSKFDVVTSFEVIEHINNPSDKVELINKILRKNGAFYFTTPNFNSISRRILNEKWNVIGFPEHLSYYTPKTIHKLMTDYSFNKIFLVTSGISFARFSQSLNKNSEIPNGINTDEALREKTESKLIYSFLKKIINAVLNLFNAGDSIKGFYIKMH